MFGRKKITPPALSEPVLHIQSMPAEFYGGANPVVQFKESKQTIVPGAPLAEGQRLASRRFLFIFGSLLFLVFVLGGSGYYWWTLRQSKPAAPVLPVAEAPLSTQPPAPLPAEPAPPAEAPATLAPPAPVASAPTAPVLSFPSTLLGDTVDLDKDGLTDAEEELFKTDLAKPDTDGDKYTDGQEVINLYNPSGQAPVKLIDSGLIKEYINPAFGYAVYYPFEWAVGAVDESSRSVLFSAITGEYIEARVFDKMPGENFADWFASQAPSEDYSQLREFPAWHNFIAGQSRRDGLVYYFENDAHWFALVYHTTDSVMVNYRSVIKMFARSFRLSAAPSILPERVVESGESENASATSAAP